MLIDVQEHTVELENVIYTPVQEGSYRFNSDSDWEVEVAINTHW